MVDQATLYSPRHVIILAHPGSHSFNSLIARTYRETAVRCGQEAIIRDLYAIGFDPVLKESEQPGASDFTLSADVADERQILESSDVFVMVYPIWFGMPPAILMGYVDRVLGAGVTPADVQKGQGPALLKGHRLASITTSGASKHWLNQQGQIDSLRTLFGTYLVNGFGMKEFRDLHFGETVGGLAQEFIDVLVGQVQTFAEAICHDAAADRQAATGT
jgi:NAD(P)H dehydrogenase (quinone)